MRRALIAAAAGITCGLAGAHRARAADAYIYNIYPSGSLGNNAAFWNASGQPYSAWYDQTTSAFSGTNLPPAGGTVSVALSGGVGVAGLSVTFNAFYGTGSAALSGLTIDSGNTLVQNSGNTQLSVMIPPPQPFGPPTGYPAHEYVGQNSTGSYAQSAGVNDADVLHLGGNAGSNGTYTLSGGNLIAGQAYVGDGGSGTFTDSGGSASAGQLIIGHAVGATGSYLLNGAGTVTVGTLIIGDSGSGTLRQTAGSIVSSSTAQNAAIVIGRSAGGSGLWDLSGGTVNFTGGVYVGGAGSGTLTLSAGSMSIFGGPGFANASAGVLAVGTTGSALASVTMSGGTVSAQGGEAVGYQGHGAFLQTGGTNQPLSFSVGVYTTDNGTATLNGGVLSTPVSYVGFRGRGTFAQSGGTHVAGTLVLGEYGVNGAAPAGSGAYTLSGQGSLQVGGDERIGDAGIGSFLQTGGTHVVGASGTGGLYIGFSTASQGIFTFAGGSFTPPRGVYVGYSGSGTLTQSAGTMTFQVPAGGTNGVFLGYNEGGNGIVNLSGTSSLFQVLAGGSEYLGYHGGGTFNQQAGTHAISGNLLVASDTYSSGTYNLSGGTLNVGGSVNLGSAGPATFNQTGGAFTASGSMTLGTSFGSATYTLSGNGLLSVGGSETLGVNSRAVSFNQYGGTHTVAGSLTTGGVVLTSTNATPVYNLYGGTLAVTGQLKVHAVQQMGGTVSAGSLSVQQYGLSSGAFLHVLQNESVLGVMTQTGGTHQVDGTLNVGSNTAGSLTLGGADSVLNVYGDENVGAVNYFGSVFQSGGIHNVGTASHTASLTVGTPNGSLPGYQISDGQLNVSGSLNVAHNAGTGGFIQVGGTVVVSGGGTGTARGFIVGSSTQGAGRVTLSAGSLSAGPMEIVGYQNTGAWTQSGGANQAGSIYVGYQNGGGTFTQSGGTSSAGSLTLGYFNVPGQVSLATAQYNLSGGVLNVSGNETVGAGAAGTMSQSAGLHTIGGALGVSSGLYKAGVLNLSGGTLTAGSTANAGAINQSGGTSTLGAITGGGTTSLSASSGPSLMNVTSFTQSKVTISGGLMRVAPAGGAVTNTATSLSISGAGVLDLNDHNLQTATAASSVRQYLTDGYNGGAWNGTAAAIVSTAAALTGGSTAMTLGYATGGTADVIGVAIPAGQTLVKYTIPGDADLSGTVDFNDFLSLQNDYGSSGDWAQGDFNYDGVVDYNDYLMLQANYGRTPTGADPSIGAAPYIAAPTPEPAAVGLVALGAVGLFSRRPRSRQPKASG